MKIIKMNIHDIQPSQLYISEKKLEKVDLFLDSIDIDGMEPLPIKKIGERVFFTDGHTRAFALFRRGIKTVKVHWDEDDLDWIQYLICLKWCDKEGIKDISHLEERVIGEEDYHELWLNRCKRMQTKTTKSLDYFITIEEVKDSDVKSNICSLTLRSLPEWFGIEESTQEYIKGVKDKFFYTLNIGDIPVGFISIKDHYDVTSEIYVIGIMKDFHNRGLGRKLIEKVEQGLIKRNKKFFTVKTLSDSHPDINYRKTREFYKAMGFQPLEEFKTLWGEENPCLLMIKTLK